MSAPSCRAGAAALCVGFALLGSLSAAPPERLEVFQTGKRFVGLDEEIFPLGWSEDGERLGLLRAWPNEAADERLWKVEVLDLVEDKAVFEKEIRHLDEGGLPAFWAAHGATVVESVAPHGLRPGTFVLHRFPALLGKFRGESYEVGLKRTYGVEPNFEYRGLTSVELTVTNDAGKSKRVFKQDWKEWFPMAAGVVGYLPNPQGDRMAIVLGMTHRGYEAAPHIRQVVIVGARVGEKF